MLVIHFGGSDQMAMIHIVNVMILPENDWNWLFLIKCIRNTTFKAVLPLFFFQISTFGRLKWVKSCYTVAQIATYHVLFDK